MAIVTLGIGSRYRRLVRSGLVSKRYYARKQGIPFILAREECLDPHRPPAWSKVNAALRYLPDHDMIFLTDADVVVMNPQIDLRQIVAGEMGNADVMLTLDCNGLQFGNVFLRHTPFVLDLLQRMYRQIHLIDHKWWEQAAFIELYESDPDVRGRTVALPQQRIFNSFAPEIGGDPSGCYRPGDLLVHFPSLRGNWLRERMNDYFALMKKTGMRGPPEFNERQRMS